MMTMLDAKPYHFAAHPPQPLRWGWLQRVDSTCQAGPQFPPQHETGFWSGVHRYSPGYKTVCIKNKK